MQDFATIHSLSKLGQTQKKQTDASKNEQNPSRSQSIHKTASYCLGLETSLETCNSKFTWVYLHVYVYIYVHICLYIYIYIHMYVCLYMYIHIPNNPYELICKLTFHHWGTSYRSHAANRTMLGFELLNHTLQHEATLAMGPRGYPLVF